MVACSKEKCEQCLKLGADRAINYKEEKFEEVVMQLTNQRGVDMILDNVGGPYLPRDISCLALDGRVVFIGLMGGRARSSSLLHPARRCSCLPGSIISAACAGYASHFGILKSRSCCQDTAGCYVCQALVWICCI